MVIDSSSRVVVIPVGISKYKEPPPSQADLGRARWGDLNSVEVDLQRFEAMFDSAPYRDAGFTILPRISGTAGEITDRLTQIAEDLAAQRGQTAERTVLLLWSGHGEAPGGRDLRLATFESYQPLTVADGLAPADLVNKLVSSGATTLCLMLDVCQAGAAGGAVAETAARRFLEQPQAEGKFSGMAALFSAHPYEMADDGLFADVMVRVLLSGPSPEAQAKIAEKGFGRFSPNNRLLMMAELEVALRAEFELLRAKNPAVSQSPVGQHVGHPFGLFPNPLYKPDSPPVNVEAARRRWLRKHDADTHFLPKARGLEPGEEGWFFSGRSAVSNQIVQWLDARGEAGAHHLYVLTGGGGTGKSSIIGRTVALSDQDYRDEARRAGWDEVADTANGTAPEVGRVDAALHLRNLTAEAAAAALSDLLGIPPPDPANGVDDFVFAAPRQLPGSDRPATIVLDALDEASEPARLAEQLIRPLAAKGWRILVGTRPSAARKGAADLLNRLGAAHHRNLDTEPTSEKDIEQYVMQRLRRTPGSPYAAAAADIDVVAPRVAAKAGGRFLYARITVSGLLRRPPVNLANLDDELGANVGDAFVRDLAAVDDRFRVAFNRTDPGATALLEALAWGEGEGLPLRDELWPIVASAVAEPGDRYTDAHVQWVLREAGRYVLESGDGEQAVYRLFHQSLNDHFRERRDAPAVRPRIGVALWANVERGERYGHNTWDLANPYIVRHLPAHLSGEPGLEQLCTNPWYLRRALALLGADRLADLLADANRTFPSIPIETIAKSVRRARVALSRDPTQLAAQLQARLASEKHPALERLIGELPAVAPPVWLRSHTATLGWSDQLATMLRFTAKLRALAFGYVDGSAVIAVSAGLDVKLWDPRSGQVGKRIIANDDLRVTGIALGIVEGREVLAVAAGYDNRLVIRDARTGVVIGGPMPCSAGTLAIGKAEGRDMVAVAGPGAFVEARSIDSREPIIERRYQAEAVGQCGGALITVERVGAHRYQVVDCETGQRLGSVLDAPEDASLIAVGEWHGQPMLCFMSRFGAGEMRDVESGKWLGNMEIEKPTRVVVIGEVEGELIVAAGDDDDVENGYVAIRQPLALQLLNRRPLEFALRGKRILGVGCAGRGKEGFGSYQSAGRLVLLIEGAGAVDPITSEIVAPTPDSGAAIQVLRGHWSRVTDLGRGSWGKRAVVAVVNGGSAAVYDGMTKKLLGSPETGDFETRAVALGELEGSPILATGSADGTVSIWEGPSMRRLASITLDVGVTGVWLGGSMLAARTADYRFHVFDVVVNV